MTDYSRACDRSYLAVHNSGKRQGVKWIVLHDEEASTAESAARYFTLPESGGSAHLCIDDSHCFRCLPNDLIAWGASSSFGANQSGFHIEQAGFARWSTVIWQRHRETLRRAAFKTAYHCHVFGVPPEYVTAANLPTKSGVTTHAQVSKASQRLDPANAGRYTHSDPGPFWPRRYFMRQVKQFYAELDTLPERG